MLAGYLGVVYITHATEGFYTYSFLDPSKQHGFLAAYIIAIAIGECLVFAVVCGVCLLRERVVGRRRAGAGQARQEMDEWEEIDRPSTPSAREV